MIAWLKQSANWTRQPATALLQKHTTAYGIQTLPVGNGRSYGDSNLNSFGTLFNTKIHRKVIAFDQQRGIINVESGIVLSDLLQHIVPHGWFLPVVPGTSFITVGGAIAHDIHGKNHIHQGNFGQHVIALSIGRTNGDVLTCSLDKNTNLFRSSIGGMGLTGYIGTATLQLKPIATDSLAQRFYQISDTLPEIIKELRRRAKEHEYCAAWLDTLSPQPRSIITGSDFMDNSPSKTQSKPSRKTTIPPLPFRLINAQLMRLYNKHYWNHHTKHQHMIRPYHQALFELDHLNKWPRLYGPKGFVQYQILVPYDYAAIVIQAILTACKNAKHFIALAVLKAMGENQSPGHISFGKAGINMAFDIPFKNQSTIDLLHILNSITFNHSGQFYPAKDFTMTAEQFQHCYDIKQLREALDPGISSDAKTRLKL